MLPCRKLAHKTGCSSCCARQRSFSTLLLQALWRRQRRSTLSCSSGLSILYQHVYPLLIATAVTDHCSSCQSRHLTPSSSGSQHMHWQVQDSMQEPSTRQCKCYASAMHHSTVPAPCKHLPAQNSARQKTRCVQQAWPAPQHLTVPCGTSWSRGPHKLQHETLRCCGTCGSTSPSNGCAVSCCSCWTLHTCIGIHKLGVFTVSCCFWCCCCCAQAWSWPPCS